MINRFDVTVSVFQNDERGKSMPKSRLKTRANRKKGKLEERLDRQNAYGINDPTPQEAVMRIRKKQNAEGKARQAE
jgi:hypothetical protein